MVTVLALSSFTLAGIVAAKLAYRAGYRAGRRSAELVPTEELFDAGYRLGWRTHAIASENLARAVAAANAANRAGIIDAAERITQEAASDD